MQGADGGDGVPTGGNRTAEPPGPMETAEDNGSAGHWQEQSDDVDGARSENSTLVRCKYDKLALEATEGGQSNAGAAGGEDDHGESVDQERRGTEEEGDKTPQRTLPAGT